MPISGRIVLNVGGRKFTTTRRTLQSYPCSILDSKTATSETEEEVFVDRDGDLFPHILEFLRNDTLAIAQLGAAADLNLLLRLKQEFSFYNLTPKTDRQALALLDAQSCTLDFFDLTGGPMPIRQLPVEHPCNIGVCSAQECLFLVGTKPPMAETFLTQYNLLTGKWTALPSLPMVCDCCTPMAYDAACVCSLLNDLILVGTFAESKASEAWKFNFSRCVWTKLAPPPAALKLVFLFFQQKVKQWMMAWCSTLQQKMVLQAKNSKTTSAIAYLFSLCSKRSCITSTSCSKLCPSLVNKKKACSS
jgi:hypothetical protein